VKGVGRWLNGGQLLLQQGLGGFLRGRSWHLPSLRLGVPSVPSVWAGLPIMLQ